ncbi:MAG: DUF370 domain-containing protein [Ruminococcaceae bacterium]|nr:DUF370 domain-containing protein [Oscillospiraceae bacterium]
MYIHLGNKTVINSKEIIGIFDLDTATVSKRTRDFLNKNEKKNNIILVSEEIPLSFVVCDNDKIYFSPVSSNTLNKRTEESFK